MFEFFPRIFCELRSFRVTTSRIELAMTRFTAASTFLFALITVASVIRTDFLYSVGIAAIMTIFPDVTYENSCTHRVEIVESVEALPTDWKSANVWLLGTSICVCLAIKFTAADRLRSKSRSNFLKQSRYFHHPSSIVVRGATCSFKFSTITGSFIVDDDSNIGKR